MENKSLNISKNVRDVVLWRLKEINGIGPSREYINPLGITKMHPGYVQIIQNAEEENGRYEVVISEKPILYAKRKDLTFMFGGKGIKEYKNAQYISELVCIHFPKISKAIKKAQEIKEEKNT